MSSRITITDAFPTGSIIIDRLEGDQAWIRQDQRGSTKPWFYWHFAVHGAGGRTMTFQFTDWDVIGCRGPAVSLDRLLSRRVLVTARHHACESSANFVLEGLIDRWLAAPAPPAGAGGGAVVDKDGVEQGDQGKFRNGHDHNRDYTIRSRYNETTAIMATLLTPDIAHFHHSVKVRKIKHIYRLSFETFRNRSSARRSSFAD